MWFITGWQWGLWLCVGVSAVCALVWVVLRRHATQVVIAWGMVTVVLAASVVVGGLRIESISFSPLVQAAEKHKVVDADVVIRTSRTSPTWGIAKVEATCLKATIGEKTYSLRQPVVVFVPSASAERWLDYPAGTVLRVSARLGETSREDEAVATMKVLGDEEYVRGPGALQGVVESMRSGLREAMVYSRDDQAALVPGLVVGDISGMSMDLRDEFRTTALTHMTVVSGAHLSVVLSFLSLLARYLGVRGRWITVVCVAGAAMFVLLCHGGPSILRASAMGLISLIGASRSQGQGSGVSKLSIAVILLAWIDPWIVRSLGFILSVLASLGIILFARHWADRLSTWLPRWLAEAMAVPLAAQIGTQVVICWISGSFSVAGVMANAGAGPWRAPATVFGLLAAVLSVLSPFLASCAGFLAGWCAAPILVIAHHLAHLPGASYPWPTSPAGMIVITMGCLMACLVIPWMLSRRWLVLVVSFAMVAIMVLPPYQPGFPGKGWQIALCDVGQGDALVVRTDHNQAILVDTGPTGGSLATCLRQLGISRIPLVVLTHYHSDHTGGFEEVVNQFHVRTLLVPHGGGDSSSILTLADSRGIPVVRGQTGSSANIGEVRMVVASAWQSPLPSSGEVESPEDNDESLVVRFDTPQMSVLATGDIEVLGQRVALKNPSLIAVDVVKVPHHGSAKFDPLFFEATGARIAIIGVGANNGYGHPSTSALSELSNLSMEVIRTDEHGSVTISHSQDWRIVTTK